MKWVFENLQIVIAIVAAIAYYLTRKARQDGAEAEREEMDPEQAERTRRVQEEIRRKIAERRGAMSETISREGERERIPPLMRPREVEPVDPFGGPLRRIVREFERALDPESQPDLDRGAQARAQAAELERQAKLAEELRALEAARIVEVRHARQALERKMAPRTAVPVFATANLRGTLRDPRELRRAIVLREILGPPVGLR
jgi:hypothetical protein